MDHTSHRRLLQRQGSRTAPKPNGKISGKCGGQGHIKAPPRLTDWRMHSCRTPKSGGSEFSVVYMYTAVKPALLLSLEAGLPPLLRGRIAEKVLLRGFAFRKPVGFVRTPVRTSGFGFGGGRCLLYRGTLAQGPPKKRTRDIGQRISCQGPGYGADWCLRVAMDYANLR